VASVALRSDGGLSTGGESETVREIGIVAQEKEAKVLADYLLSQQITSKVMPAKAGWSIWVHDEDRVPQAVEAFRAFREEPNAERFVAARSTARAVKKAMEKAKKEHEKKSLDFRDRWEGSAWRKYPLTLVMILISIGVSLATGMGRDQSSPTFHALVFSDYYQVVDFDSEPPRIVRVSRGLSDIAKGQVWRLVTPIFLHFGPFHILFNMLFLRSFGGMIEFRKGTLRFFVLVLVSAIVSNVCQYLTQSRATDVAVFGGMSGVGYALFGYLWAKGYSHPEEHLGVNQSIIIQMVVWFIVCASGQIGPIANTAHGVGLMVGLLFGLTRF
jgi:GlpG protein